MSVVSTLTSQVSFFMQWLSATVEIIVVPRRRTSIITNTIMPLSWNEIRNRALAFTRTWTGETREHAEAKSFWDAFFHVFGVERRVVASFEAPVRSLDKKSYGRIDLLWHGVLLVEHKSAGGNLSNAELQAFRYIQALHTSGRSAEVPRYIVVSDFSRFILHDTEESTISDFSLSDLHKHVHEFAFIAGYRTTKFDPESPANLKAAQMMADLHDALDDGGYRRDDLEQLLTRILFCLFAEDTGIFEPNAFTDFIENRTATDGSDLGARLAELFQTLNTQEDHRQKHLDESLAILPYVNGALFAKTLSLVAFDSNMRESLLACARFDWSAISPAIFGSLFQGIMDPPERRQIGAHYTGEGDIMKVLRSTFLDALERELQATLALKVGQKRRLSQLHHRIAKLQFLDPACGCGNFLILAYRELRRLEEIILVALHGKQATIDIGLITRVSIEQFHGIELVEFPAEIARVGMWLMEHQMNMRLSIALGQYFRRLPLVGSAHIVCANALTLDWDKLVAPSEDVIIIGNPPFVGKKEQSAQQKQDLARIWSRVKGGGILDYVTCWYAKAADFMQGTRARCTFVSTNSIAQGEQVGVLWHHLLERGVKIHFAHQTFAWTSEARGKAHVHVVIIGFGMFDVEQKTLFEYDHGKSVPTSGRAANINPYLLEGPDWVALTRRRPLSEAIPPIAYGNMMIDKPRNAGEDAGLTFGPDQRAILLRQCPGLRPYIRRLVGGEEFIKNIERWCMWFVDVSPKELRAFMRDSPDLRRRLKGIREFRMASGRAQTRNLATTPTLFGEIRQPSGPYLLIPKVSSENRRYIPIGFMKSTVIASGSALIIPGADFYHFGVLSSSMHNAWMRVVAGRMKSDYQYSSGIVYNNFVWPGDVSARSHDSVVDAAKSVLEAREHHRDATLAHLYDPLTMPADLAKAHQRLDRAVERCYRKQVFRTDRERAEFLLQLAKSVAAS